MISEQQLAEWERLANKATEGPWYAYEGRDYSEISLNDGTTPRLAKPLALVGSKHEDAEFIAVAREAVPALIAEVRKMNKKYALLLEQGREDQEHAVDLRMEAYWLASQCVSLYGSICSEVSASDYDNDPEMNVDHWLEEARRVVKDASS